MVVDNTCRLSAVVPAIQIVRGFIRLHTLLAKSHKDHQGMIRNKNVRLFYFFKPIQSSLAFCFILQPFEFLGVVGFLKLNHEY